MTWDDPDAPKQPKSLDAQFRQLWQGCAAVAVGIAVIAAALLWLAGAFR